MRSVPTLLLCYPAGNVCSLAEHVRLEVCCIRPPRSVGDLLDERQIFTQRAVAYSVSPEMSAS